VATARAAEAIWQQARDELEGKKAARGDTWVRSLTVPAEAGPDALLELTEMAAQPGTAVEAGGLVARLVDYRQPLIRLDLPADLVRQAPPPTEVEVRILAPGGPGVRGIGNQPEPLAPESAMRAVRIGPAPQMDASSQFVSYLYQVGAPLPSGSAGPAIAEPAAAQALRRLWRPGLFVTAQLENEQAAPQDAVSVPAGALLYHEARALIYVQIEPDRYQRREVRVLGYQGDRCVLAPWSLLDPPTIGLRKYERVVSDQAQVLLAAEFRRDTDDD
jgi:hypothetical protein